MDGNGELADDVTDLHVMSPDWRAVQTQDKASHMHEVTVQALRRGVIRSVNNERELGYAESSSQCAELSSLRFNIFATR